MKNKLVVFAVAAVCFAIVGTPAVSSAAGAKFSLGAGVAFVPEYEGSEDYMAAPVPHFSAQWDSGRYIRLNGNALTANLLANDTWSLGPVLQYRAARDQGVDNNPVSRMKNIDAAVDSV